MPSFKGNKKGKKALKQENKGPETGKNKRKSDAIEQPSKKKNCLSALQLAMKKKLDGAKFRMINEDLYTSHSSLSFGQFQSDPKLFDVYHKGFREQVKTHPTRQPLNGRRKGRELAGPSVG
mmetsp:Transcript_6431/g.9640  ORF Transcript_6431/g.9640 Transcript_6431/m.9640 type:complete len:121 (-) Transcript_6431:465-827(-)